MSIDVETTAPRVLSDCYAVEEQLGKTMMRLSEADSNIQMFSKMVSRGIATNDVRNFAKKQATNKKADGRLDKRVVKTSMKSKLKDACMTATKLRREKTGLCKQLSDCMKDDRWRYKRRLKALNQTAKEHRMRCDARNARKLKLCGEKMRALSTKDDVPGGTMELLEDVNVFKKDRVSPEEPRGPMVCDSNIKLSEE